LFVFGFLPITPVLPIPKTISAKLKSISSPKDVLLHVCENWKTYPER